MKFLIRFSLLSLILLFLIFGVSFSQGITLHMLMEDVPETHIIKELLPDFEKKTGIKVEFETILYSDMHPKLVPQLMSPQSQYDVLEVDNYWAGEFPAAGWLEPLEEYVKRSNFDLSVYIPSSLEMTGYYKGKLYMIPMYNYAMALIYRKDIMNDPKVRAKYKEIKKKELTLPKTLDEYVDLAKFMKKYVGIDGSAMQAQRGDPIVMEWTNYLYALGGSYYDKNWKVTINDWRGIKATQLYIDCLKNAAPLGALSFNLDDAFRVMSQGKAFSYITYWWMLPQLEDPSKSTVAGKVDIAPIPGKGGLNGGWGWAIPKNLPKERKEAAWKFIEWVESFEIAKKRALMGGAPTRYDVFKDPEVLKKYPFYTTVMKIIEKARPVPEFQYSAEMIEIVGRELSLAATEKKDIKKALNDAAKELNDLAIKAGLRR
jgi:ABC-type glycerol-3-phosphate transport system substrate-binding protein